MLEGLVLLGFARLVLTRYSGTGNIKPDWKTILSNLLFYVNGLANL